jgi:uncharacterized Zn finger protein (UPF0148 family)
MIDLPEHYRIDAQERSIDFDAEPLMDGVAHCYYCGKPIKRKDRKGTGYCTDRCQKKQIKEDEESAALEQEIQDQNHD